MSRFADPSRTKIVPIGPCDCPGTPHAGGDVATVRLEFGYQALGEIGSAGALAFGDFTASRRKLIELGVVSWNLIGPDGKEWPPNEANIALLDEPTIDALASALDEAVEMARRALPNASGAPSADGSPGSASPTLETEPTTTSTTS